MATTLVATYVFCICSGISGMISYVHSIQQGMISYVHSIQGMISYMYIANLVTYEYNMVVTGKHNTRLTGYFVVSQGWNR